MKKITLLFALLISSIGFSQQVEVLQDFETSPNARDPFGGAAFSIVADPETGGTRGQVMLATASASGQFFQGVNIDLTENVDLTSNKTMTMDVFSNSPITIAPKVVAGVNSAPDSTTSATHSGSGWETLSFTFDKGYDGTTTANGAYTVLVIYYLWRSDNTGFIDPAIDRTFYVDNISGIKATVEPPTPPSVAAPTPPARNAADVISIFSDAYSDITVDTFSANFDDSSIEDVNIDGNPTKKVTFTNFLGIDFQSNKQDLSSMTHFHMDFYVDRDDLTGTVFNSKFSEWGGTSAEVSAFELPINTGTTPAIVSETWVSIDVPFTAWTNPPQTRGDIAQFLITSNLGTVWIDNIYVYREATASVDDNNAIISMYPNPVSNRLQISANGNIERAEVYNTLGKKVLEVEINKNLENIDVSNLSSGVYLLKYFVDGKLGTSRFIKN